MGDRSATETLAQVFLTLLKERTVSQAELARIAEVDVRAVKRCLLDMQSAGMPLERTEDHPHVYWSVSKSWVPGGAVIASSDLVELVRNLGRAPATDERDQLLRKLMHRAGAGLGGLPDVDRVLSPSIASAEAEHLRIFEDALQRRHAVSMRFFSSKRGRHEDRYVSVQRVVLTAPPKLVAVCHREDRLKWFRLDNVDRAHVDPNAGYREVSDEEVEHFLRETRFGFNQPGERIRCVFVVRDPDHRWIEREIGPGVQSEPCEGGIRYSLETAGIEPLARFLVSWGPAVRVETPELAVAVRALAQGALRGLPERPRNPE